MIDGCSEGQPRKRCKGPCTKELFQIPHMFVDMCAATAYIGIPADPFAKDTAKDVRLRHEESKPEIIFAFEDAVIERAVAVEAAQLAGAAGQALASEKLKIDARCGHVDRGVLSFAG